MNVPATTEPIVQTFLVCGLGELGAYSLEGLRQFSTADSAIRIHALDRQPQELLAALPQVAGEHLRFFAGDCRIPGDLERAGIRGCRAALFVTDDESSNIQGALAAHRLNPAVRLVVRCTKSKLNRMLQAEIGNFVALDPAELPASAFVTAALQSHLLSGFEVDGRRFEVTEERVGPGSALRPGDAVSQLDSRHARVISWTSAQGQRNAAEMPTNAFYQWDHATKVRPKDVVVSVRVLEAESSNRGSPNGAAPRRRAARLRRARRFLQSTIVSARGLIAQQARRPVLAIGLLSGLLLLIITTIVLRTALPNLTWMRAISASILLLLGGYGDVFGGLDDEHEFPVWLQLYALFVTGFSVVCLLGVLGVVADTILNARLEFLRKRVPVPTEGHLILVGYKRLAREVTKILRRIRQPFVVVSHSGSDVADFDDATLPIVKLTEPWNFEQVHLAEARGVMILTEDALMNLEFALGIRQALADVPRAPELVVRVFDRQFSQSARQLLPEAKVLTSYQIAGEAFAAAAFGEQILGLFRLGDQSVLVADYAITLGDHLHDRLIAEVAYGYGVVPIFLRRQERIPNEQTEVVFPRDDLRLRENDRLVLLATLNGLRRIENGQLSPPRRWKLWMKPPLTNDFMHEAGAEIARCSGCPLGKAMAFVQSLPGEIELELYTHQAHSLDRTLRRQFEFALQPLDQPPTNAAMVSGTYRV